MLVSRDSPLKHVKMRFGPPEEVLDSLLGTSRWRIKKSEVLDKLASLDKFTAKTKIKFANVTEGEIKLTGRHITIIGVYCKNMVILSMHLLYTSISISAVAPSTYAPSHAIGLLTSTTTTPRLILIH
jgi:hypothetical protein